MKIADVKIGAVYITNVSGSLVKVVAIARVEPDGRFDKTARFRVRRVDNGKVLNKTRAASALRPLPALDPIVAELVDDVKAARALEAAGKWEDAVAAWEYVKKKAAENNQQRMVTYAVLRATMVRATMVRARAEASK